MKTIVLLHLKLKPFPIKKAVLNSMFYPARSQLYVTEFLQEISEERKNCHIPLFSLQSHSAMTV